MQKRINLILLLGLFIFTGCAMNGDYVPNSVVLPAYVKKIAIIGFRDDVNTNLFIQDKLLYSVKDAFINDSRVAMTRKDEADAWLFGTITRYVIDTLEYDQNMLTTKYQLWVWVDISLVDSATQQLMWTESRLEAKIKYGTSNDSFAPSTEVEAQELAVKVLAEKIVKRTIDGWFAASGVSERL